MKWTRGLAVGPAGVQLRGHVLHPALVAAAVADEHDVREPVRAEARADVGQQAAEGLLGQADRRGVAHVLGGRVDVPLGHERDDRRDQGVAELPRDGLGRRPEHVVVLARRQVRPVLLHAAGGDDHRVLAAPPQRVADLHPGHLLEEDRVERVDRARRLRIGTDRVRPAGLGPGEQDDGEEAHRAAHRGPFPFDLVDRGSRRIHPVAPAGILSRRSRRGVSLVFRGAPARDESPDRMPGALAVLTTRLPELLSARGDRGSHPELPGRGLEPMQCRGRHHDSFEMRAVASLRCDSNPPVPSIRFCR